MSNLLKASVKASYKTKPQAYSPLIQTERLPYLLKSHKNLGKGVKQSWPELGQEGGKFIEGAENHFNRRQRKGRTSHR